MIPGGFVTVAASRPQTRASRYVHAHAHSPRQCCANTESYSPKIKNAAVDLFPCRPCSLNWQITSISAALLPPSPFLLLLLYLFFTLPQLPENIGLPRCVRDSLRRQQQLECSGNENPGAHSHLQGVRPPAHERCREETQLFCYVRRENLYFGLVTLSAYLLFIAPLRLIPPFCIYASCLKGAIS